MIRQGAFSLFAGLAAFDARSASNAVLTAGSGIPHGDFANGLGDMQSGLKDHEENAPLRTLYDAIDGYRHAVDSSEAGRIASAQTHLAKTVGSLSNETWRRATFPLFEPALAERLANLAYLTDVLTALRHVAGSRPYTLSASPDDKQFLRAIVGGLSAFIENHQTHPDVLIVGMTQETGAQIRDAAVITLAAAAGTALPALPTTNPAVIVPPRAETTAIKSPVPKSAEPSLSPCALKGLAVLQECPHLKENLRRFQKNPEAQRDGGVQKILETVARLHERGVSGYETGFLPNTLDGKFLSTDDSTRIHSLLAEYRQALEIARRPGVSHIHLGDRLTIEWLRSSDDIRPWINKFIRPDEFMEDDYTLQRSVEIDVNYISENGGRRIVEVKTHRGEIFNPQNGEERKFILQLLRHSLLVRQHGLEALEYFFEVRKMSTEFLERIRSLLTLFKIPYFLHVQEEGGTPETFSGRPSQPVVPVIQAVTPTPAAPPPSSGKLDAPESEHTELPWTEGMKEFLDDILPVELRINVRRMTSAREFIRKVQLDLRHAHRRELFDNLKDAIASIPESDAGGKITQMAVKKGNTISHADLAEVVRIAARATGASTETPAVPTAETSPDPVDQPSASTPSFSERWAANWKGPESASSLETAIDLFGARLSQFETEVAALANPDAMEFYTLLNTRDHLPAMSADAENLSSIQKNVLSEEALQRMDDLPPETIARIDGFGGRLEEARLSIEIANETVPDAAARAEASEENQARQRKETAEALAQTGEALATLGKQLEEIGPFLEKARTAMQDIDRLPPPESLSASFYAHACSAAEESTKEALRRTQDLDRASKSYRSKLGRIPARVIQGEVAAKFREFEDQEATVGRLLADVDAAVALPLQRLRGMEVRIPASPPVAVPPPPPFSTRRFQVNEKTPRKVLEILAAVPEEFYQNANASPELALLAPDHEVYERLLGRSDFDFEQERLSPERYHLRKYEYFLSLIRLMPKERETALEHFERDHLNNSKTRECGDQQRLVQKALATPSVARLAKDRLTKRIPMETVAKHIVLYLENTDSVLRLTLKNHSLRSILKDDQIIADYLTFNEKIRSLLPKDAGDEMTAAMIGGRPIEEFAPDLRSAEWGKETASAWADGAGEMTPGLWAERLSHARVLSAPEQSHIVLGQGGIKVASKYIESRGDYKITDDVTGKELNLPQGGRGYRLLPEGAMPAGSWYGSLLDRLRLLGDRPSPMLDFVATIFEKRSEGLFGGFWAGIIGLVMQGPENVTGKELRERIAVWAIAEKSRLRKIRELRKIIDRAETPDSPSASDIAKAAISGGANDVSYIGSRAGLALANEFKPGAGLS